MRSNTKHARNKKDRKRILLQVTKTYYSLHLMLLYIYKWCRENTCVSVAMCNDMKVERRKTSRQVLEVVLICCLVISAISASGHTCLLFLFFLFFLSFFSFLHYFLAFFLRERNVDWRLRSSSLSLQVLILSPSLISCNRPHPWQCDWENFKVLAIRISHQSNFIYFLLRSPDRLTQLHCF